MADEDVIPPLGQLERRLLEQLHADWQSELEDLTYGGKDRETYETYDDPVTLRSLARWAEARHKLAAHLRGECPITELEPWEDLIKEGLVQTLEIMEEVGELGGEEPPSPGEFAAHYMGPLS